MSEFDPYATLEAFVGTWSMEAVFGDGASTGPLGQTVWDWLPDKRFLVQRWETASPDAPDGIAVIGFDDDKGTYLQHYFDSRGVARVYDMSVVDGVWTLVRTTADFSPLGFPQRYRAAFAKDGATISGRWESSPDGSAWTRDFDLSYTKTAAGPAPQSSAGRPNASNKAGRA